MKSMLTFGMTAILALAMDVAQAQTTPPTATVTTTSANSLEEVVVTGTRRSDRTVADSASPVDVISNTDLTAQPAANMMDQVKYLVPSFFVGQNTISDASTIVRSPSLRGLPADEILVMMNGKRFNRSALVQVYVGGDTALSFGSQGSDLSSLPSIGVKHLEVLRDGATAQYGSDAIAGVLNYGLRDDEGLEVQALYGQYKDDNDGQSHQYAADWGTRWDRGFVNIAGEYDSDGQTSRGVTRPTAVSFAQENPTLANTIPNYPLPAQIWGQSPTHGYKFLLNSGIRCHRQQQGLLVRQLRQQPHGRKLQLPLLAPGLAHLWPGGRRDGRRRRPFVLQSSLLPDAMPGRHSHLPGGWLRPGHEHLQLPLDLSGRLHAALHRRHHRTLRGAGLQGHRRQTSATTSRPRRAATRSTWACMTRSAPRIGADIADLLQVRRPDPEGDGRQPRPDLPDRRSGWRAR